MRHVFAVAAAAAFACALTGPAAAADAAPPLAGETLQYSLFTPQGAANHVTVTAQCDPNGTSTIAFEAAGLAAGTYPGTFTARGTATIGPHTPGFLKPTGDLLSFRETFHIDSAVGTVDGTKTISISRGDRESGTNIGTCFDVSGPGLNEPPFYNESGFQYLAYATTTYDATIHTATGTSRQTGTSGVHVYDLQHCFSGDPSMPATGCRFAKAFVESFWTSVPAVDATPAAVAVSPATAVNDIGTTHTVTATVLNAEGSALEGVAVLFATSGATTTSGSCTTNASGACSYTYRGPYLPGSDVITACADANGNGVVDAGEPCGTATKTWVGPETKDACKNGLWRNFGLVFQNQGDCVSFVATGGRNLPAIVG